MKVAHIIDTLQWGGAQKLLTTFAAEAAKRAIPTTVISLNSDREIPAVREQLERHGVKIECLPASKMFSPSRFVSLIKLLRRERFDVIQTHLTYANILGPLATLFVGTPVVGTLHLAGADPTLVPRKQQIENHVLRWRVKSLIAVGFVVADVYKQLIPKRTIHVIPNAVEPIPELPNEQRTALRKTLMNGATDGPLLVSVGRLSAIKAFPDLIAAWAIVTAKHPKATLRIAGGGEAETHIREKISSHGLDQAILLGQRDDIPHILQAADIFVSSSQLEGLPVAVLEALAAGLPVVATDVGDVARVTIPEVGIVVEPQQPVELARAINTLLNDPQKMQAMQQAARDHVRAHYNPEQWFDQLLTVYEAAQA